MILYVQLGLAILILMLAWVFFRYLIRLVKSNEAIADSLEEISQSLHEIAEKNNETNQEE